MSKSIYDTKINNIDFITVTTSSSCLDSRFHTYTKTPLPLNDNGVFVYVKVIL